MSVEETELRPDAGYAESTRVVYRDRVRIFVAADHVTVRDLRRRMHRWPTAAVDPESGVQRCVYVTQRKPHQYDSRFAHLLYLCDAQGRRICRLPANGWPTNKVAAAFRAADLGWDEYRVPEGKSADDVFPAAPGYVRIGTQPVGTYLLAIPIPLGLIGASITGIWLIVVGLFAIYGIGGALWFLRLQTRAGRQGLM
ncbi:MAG: hypothetical protein ACRDJU_13015 [Actinomycetota bacterium]